MECTCERRRCGSHQAAARRELRASFTSCGADIVPSDWQRVAFYLLCTPAAHCHGPGPPSAGCDELKAIVVMKMCLHVLIKTILNTTNSTSQKSFQPHTIHTPILTVVSVIVRANHPFASHLLTPTHSQCCRRSLRFTLVDELCCDSKHVFIWIACVGFELSAFHLKTLSKHNKYIFKKPKKRFWPSVFICLSKQRI